MNAFFTAIGVVLISMQLYGQTVSQDVNALLEKFRKDTETPGISVALVSCDTIITACAGVAAVDSTIPIMPESKYHLGSLTKSVTSFIIAKYVEAGVLQWETRFIDIFPELKGEIDARYHAITMADLLSHKSKVQRFTSRKEYMTLPDWPGDAAEQRVPFLKFLLNLEPGEFGKYNFYYSNAGYSVAAAIVERITGKSWEQLVDETFNALGWQYYIGFPNKEDEGNAWGHRKTEDEIVAILPADDFRFPPLLGPSGDLSMNIIDFAGFVQLNLRGLTGQNNWLKTETYETLHFRYSDYAMGWMNEQSDEYGAVSSNDGSVGTYFCLTILYKEKNCAVCVMINMASREASRASYPLTEALLKYISQ